MTLSSDENGIPGGTVVLTNSTFHTNRATLENAGVVYAGEHATINVTSGFFFDNEAAEDGGVLAASENSTINIDGGSFFGNAAGGVKHWVCAFLPRLSKPSVLVVIASQLLIGRTHRAVLLPKAT